MPAASTIMPEVSAFLEQFDAYVAARAELRKAEDGSEDEQLCITRCAHEWDLLRARRAALPDATDSGAG